MHLWEIEVRKNDDSKQVELAEEEKEGFTPGASTPESRPSGPAHERTDQEAGTDRPSDNKEPSPNGEAREDSQEPEGNWQPVTYEHRGQDSDAEPTGDTPPPEEEATGRTPPSGGNRSPTGEAPGDYRGEPQPPLSAGREATTGGSSKGDEPDDAPDGVPDEPQPETLSPRLEEGLEIESGRRPGEAARFGFPWWIAAIAAGGLFVTALAAGRTSSPPPAEEDGTGGAGTAMSGAPVAATTPELAPDTSIVGARYSRLPPQLRQLVEQGRLREDEVIMGAGS